jgi:acyl carrier protein
MPVKSVMVEKLDRVDLESMLIEMFELTLEIGGVGRESNFFACGGDSISALELTGHLSSRLKLDINMEELPLWASVSAIAEFLQDMLANADRQDPG